MADLMIKGLTPNVAGAVNPTGSAEGEGSKDAMQVFASLMSRADGTETSDKDLFSAAKTNMKTADQPITPDTFRDKVVKEQPRTREKEITPEMSEKLQEVNNRIKQEVMEEYDITEEELESVMQTLGLDYIQLLLPENLVKLSVELTGAADSLELLSSAGFNELYGLMQDISAEITEGLGIAVTPGAVETFAEVINPMTVSDAPDLVPEAPVTEAEGEETLMAAAQGTETPIADTGLAPEEADVIRADTLADKIEEAVTEGIEKGTVQIVQEGSETAEAVTVQAETATAVTETVPDKAADEKVTVQEESKPLISSEETDPATPVITENTPAAGEADNGEEGTETGGNEKKDLTPEAGGSKAPAAETGTGTESRQVSSEGPRPAAGSRTATNTPSNTAAAPAVFDNFRNIAPEMPVDMAAPLSQADTASIIRQISDYMRLNFNGPETSLEMQLNPENLGRVGINLSVRDGVVSAQIAVQNEAVKTAIESQMVILRENMANQGLKVEAVEVTIASHEFEQNLENGAPTGQQEQQGGRNSSSDRGTRNINLNETGSLEDLPDADALAARIMADNGNRMDIQA